MDLSSFINKSECECLNESDDHPLTHALTTKGGFLESDCDEQVCGIFPCSVCGLFPHSMCGLFPRSVWPLSSQCVAYFLTVRGLFPRSVWPLSLCGLFPHSVWPFSSQCVASFLTVCGLFPHNLWPFSSQCVASFLAVCGLFPCSVWPLSSQCLASFLMWPLSLQWGALSAQCMASLLTVCGLFPFSCSVASFLAVCGLFPHNVWPLSLQSAESSVWTVVFSSPAHFWVFSGTCVSLATSHCHSVSFCIALCAVSALNSQALQSEACISAAKHKR